jgi:hypothetical protein
LVPGGYAVPGGDGGFGYMDGQCLVAYEGVGRWEVMLALKHCVTEVFDGSVRQWELFNEGEV